MHQENHSSVFTNIEKNWKALLYLGCVLLLTIGGMIAYQFFRKDPVRVIVKNDQGYYCSQTVNARQFSTVRQAISKTDFLIDADTYTINVDENSRVKDAGDIELVKKISGTIEVDGEVIEYTSGAHSVEEVLEENEVTLSPVDELNVSESALLQEDNKDIVIYRVTSAEENGEEVLPFNTVNQETDELAFGETQVVQQGIEGKRTFTDEVTYHNGVEVSRETLTEERVEPVDQIVKVGTNMKLVVPDVEEGDIEGWRPYVVKALEANGLEATTDRVERVLRQIKTESNGDQTAQQQVVDINMILGHPAQGLMQTIPSTFEAYKHEGYDDILNGYHNLLAAINYAKTVYGDDLSALGNGSGY